MKKIIAISGKSNVGKTQTLKLLIDKLDKVGVCKHKEVKEFNDIKRTYKYKETIISICTAGDAAYIIESNIEYFKNHNCDIAITAVRTKGKTQLVLNSFAKELGLKVDYISKVIDKDNAQQVNEKFADDLLDMIDDTIKTS